MSGAARSRSRSSAWAAGFPAHPTCAPTSENILAGRDCIARSAARSLGCERSFATRARRPTTAFPRAGAAIWTRRSAFDAAAHGIMPRTIEGGEPEQFLVLDAAIGRARGCRDCPCDVVEGDRVEVVIGRGNYFNRGNLTRLQHGRMIGPDAGRFSPALHPEWSEADRDAIRADLQASLPPFEAATIPGQLTNATAGRIAHRLDLSGASFVVDAASASSLVARRPRGSRTCRRRADLAIAGGVYLEADVDFPLVFRQLNALSRSGTARPFAADADGMLPGEGVGVVVLKRLADAERDGDRIYAVVQGVGLASDGGARAWPRPVPAGTPARSRRAYRRAGIDPATVMLVEGHGLGVPAADRAELRALNAVFPPPPHGRRSLGAVSSMIGHAMPAAGMAGLIKTALALYHRVLPPTLHAENAARRSLDHPERASLSTQRPAPGSMPMTETPRRAGVNAFGFAGINAHAVLEEHPPPPTAIESGRLRRLGDRGHPALRPDRAGLLDRARELIAGSSTTRRIRLKDIAYTLNSGREHPSRRRASGPGRVVRFRPGRAPRRRACRDWATRSCHAIRDGRGIYYWDEPLLNGRRRAAWRSSSRGGLAISRDARRPLLPLSRKCARMFDTADRIARDLGEIVPPSEHLFGPVPGGDEKLWSTATAVNVVLNAQWAFTRY